MLSKPGSHPLLTRLLLPVELQSQVGNLATLNDTMAEEHAGTPNNGRTFQQTAAYRHPGAGSQWPAAQNTSSYSYYTSLNTGQQISLLYNGTPLQPNGLQNNCSQVNQGNIYQDSRFINSHPPQSSLQKPKADYLQQNLPAQWNANQWKEYNILVSQYRMKESRRSDAGMTAKPAPPSNTTTTTSPPHQHRVNTGQCESSVTHNNQVIYNHCVGENKTQQASSYYRRPHSYFTQSQQPSRVDYLKSTPIQQGTRVSRTGQTTQQTPAQFSPTFHSEQAITQTEKDKKISRIIESLKRCYSVNRDVCSTANGSSLYRGAQSSITTQPRPTNTSNAHQSSVFVPGETLPEYIPVISPTQDMAVSSQRTVYVPCNVLNVPMIDQNKSVGKELRNSQSPETPPSTTEEDSAISPCGHTTSKAIAVVQPLSQQSCQASSNHDVFDAVGYKSAAAGSRESPPEASEKPVCAQELSSGLAGGSLADQHDAQMTPPSDVPRSQSCESEDDPEASIPKSSSGHTVTWTIKELQKLIETAETDSAQQTDLVDGRIKVCQLFQKNLGTDKARKDLLHSLMECKIFVKTHVTPYIELAQLKPDVEQQHYHILRDNDRYTEPPFRSTWLNINDQLDDIDKEFGFPPCLRFTHIQKRDSQVDLVTAASMTPEQSDSEVSEKDWKQAEPELIESDVESSPVRTASHDDTQDCDPCYSFKIQVFSPEEAKLIYEQTESLEQHSEVASVENQYSDLQPEKDACGSVAGDVPDLSVALLHETGCVMEEFCCLSTLVRNIFESNPPAAKCQCGAKKSVEAVIDITESDSDDSVTEVMDISRRSPCEEIILLENQNDSSTDDASLYPKIDDVYTCADAESIQSMLSAACDSKIENPSGSDMEISSLESEVEDKQLSHVSSDSSMETEELTAVSTKTAPLPGVSLMSQSEENKPETRAVSPQSSWCELPTRVESQLSSRPEVSVDPPVRKCLGSNSEAAQLVLFGSVQSPGETYKRKRYFSSEGAVCASSKPPEVLSVPLCSMKRQFSDPLPVQEQSVKNKIFEMWRKSFPVQSLKRRGKNTQGSALSAGPQEKQAASPEKKLKLLDPSQRPGDGSQCRIKTKCISPGEL